MKKSIVYLFVLLCVGLFSACQQEELAGFEKSNSQTSKLSTKSMETELSRVHFKNQQEFISYLDSIKEQEESYFECKCEEYFSDASDIVKQYLKVSPLARIYNEVGEFQIGDTIVKLGKSGYSEYLILESQYSKAIQLINQESDILLKYKSYSTTEEELYVLDEGVYLSYTEEPIFLEQSLKSTKAIIGNYNVDVRFWSSSSFVFNGCGIEMSYQEYVNGKFQDYSTDLDMRWNYITIVHKVKTEKIGEFISIGSGYKTDTGAYDKKTFNEKGGFNIGKYHYILQGGNLVGRAKTSAGTWIEDIHIQ